MAFSELSTVKDVLKELDSHRENDSIFLELLACKGGCINGPAKLSHISPALKRYEIIHQSELGNLKDDFKNIDLQILFCKDPHVQDHTYTEEEINEFREIMYTMKEEEVAGWCRSLQLRGIEIPDELKDELFLIVGERRFH